MPRAEFEPTTPVFERAKTMPSTARPLWSAFFFTCFSCSPFFPFSFLF
jgi:hypothetical protein